MARPHARAIAKKSFEDERRAKLVRSCAEDKTAMVFVSPPPPPAIAAASSPPATAICASGIKLRRGAPPRVPRREIISFDLRARRRLRDGTRLNAGLTEIEPDLEEDPHDKWRTNGVDPEDYKYGEYDGHHTYFEGDNKVDFWESIVADYKAVEPPSGFQGVISWLFLPAIVAGLAYHVPGDYLYIGAAVFVVIFCAIEMGKPDKPHNFEPQIYNMDRAARDKLIADYNSMDIWDFNEKYGELWDFTVKNDDIVKL